MKKSIVYLSLALALSANAFASDFNSGTYYSSNPLCVAISKGDSETAKKIIEYGGDVNQTYNGLTPLMIASRYNNVELINILIAKGASIDKKDEKGNTALRHAELSNAKEAVEALKLASKK